MIFPTSRCVITQTVGTNENGKPILGSRFPTLCSVVKLVNSSKKTSIRTDRSASQGNAEDLVSQSKLLFTPSTKITINDLVAINGIILVVTDVELRVNNLSGEVDHLDVDLRIYGS